jgi:hypothetical protein
VGDHGAESEPVTLLIRPEQLLVVVADQLRRLEVDERDAVLLGAPAQNLQVGPVDRQGAVVEPFERHHWPDPTHDGKGFGLKLS